MTTETREPLESGLAFFEAFGERIVNGLRGRMEGEIACAGPEVVSTDRASLAGQIGEGAVLARATWGEAEASGSGCLLGWGAVSALLDAKEIPIPEFTEDDLATLRTNLRLVVESGGEGPPVLEWGDLEVVAGDRIEDSLRDAGIPANCEVARLDLTISGGEMTFLVATATEGPEGSSETPTPEAGTGDLPEGEESVPDDPEEGFTPESPVESATGPGELGNLHHLLSVRMPLTIRLGSTQMRLEEILRLTPGAILELDQREEAPLEVLANGHVIARGEVVVLDERFGLRITEIGSSEERLKATL
jgi:flagellar motor switch protein FliN